MPFLANLSACVSGNGLDWLGYSLFSTRWMVPLFAITVRVRRGCSENLAPRPGRWLLEWHSDTKRFLSSTRFPSASPSLDGQGNILPPEENSNTAPALSLATVLEAVADDMQTLDTNLLSILRSENMLIASLAEQMLVAGGKRLRPALVFLVSRATMKIMGLDDLTPEHRCLAEIVEMIHTASLLHDDVLDDCSTRRGMKAIHKICGVHTAVLAGDFMFAHSSWLLAQLGNLEVIRLISQVIKDFATGEMSQASMLFNCDLRLEEYMVRCCWKTASLISASTKASAIFSGVSMTMCNQMYEYGKNIGLSFQVVDDILDFTQSVEQLGKPASNDLLKGNLTAPVIFALMKEPCLREIISSGYKDPGSIRDAIQLVHKSGGLKQAQDLAKEKADLAILNLCCLPQTGFRRSLEAVARYNLQRIV